MACSVPTWLTAWGVQCDKSVFGPTAFYLATRDSSDSCDLLDRSGMSAVMAEMTVAHDAHLKPSDLSTPALAGPDSDSSVPDTALAAASLLHAPGASQPSSADAAPGAQLNITALVPRLPQILQHTEGFVSYLSVSVVLQAMCISPIPHHGSTTCFSNMHLSMRTFKHGFVLKFTHKLQEVACCRRC